MIVYDPLWETMKKKNITQYDLVQKYKFSTGTLDALRQNRSVTVNTINNICRILECRVEDVMVYEE